jgi:uncharacterized protein YjbI with pentapeptide repeats
MQPTSNDHRFANANLLPRQDPPATLMRDDLLTMLTKAKRDSSLYDETHLIPLGKKHLTGDLKDLPLERFNLSQVTWQDAMIDHDTLTTIFDHNVMNFTGLNLSNQDFHGGIIKRPELGISGMQYANLEHIILSKCRLNGANFSRANLDYACLDHVKAERTDFSHALIRQSYAVNADFTGSNFCNTDFTSANLRGAIFDHATFNQHTCFNGADVTQASFVDIYIIEE